MKKENENVTENSCNEQQNKVPNIHLSDTIKNAHASGDGAMERAKDSLLEPDEDENIDGTRKPKPNENY